MSLPQATHSPASLQRPADAPHGPGLLSAAGLSLLLHAVLFALLAWQWQPAPTPPPASAPVLITQLIAPPTPAPPAPAAPTPPPLEQPQAQPREQTPPPVEEATLARKRVQEQQRQREQEQQRLQEQKSQAQRQRERAEQQAREQAEREHQAALAAAAEAQRAEQQARAQAEQWAANNHDYAPLDKPAPDYPERALSRGIEGDCTVEYTVTAAGRVENPQVVGDCHPLFIRTSLNAAKAFRYQPRRVDGQPQAVANVRNTFHYRIEEQR